MGDKVIHTAATRIQRTMVGDRPATEAELAAYEEADRAFTRCAEEALASPDTTLAEAAAPLGPLPWLPSVLNWEAPIIAAADAAALSLRDWHANLLEGGNWELPGGLGAFVLRRLLPGAGPVRLNTPANVIDWGGHGVTVETSSGSLRADACIVTVSTGVLAADCIRFTPALPVRVQEAIRGLPMGVLNKVALRAAGDDRLGVPNSCGVDQFVPAIDAPAMTMVAWPHGQDHVICFHGGSHSAEAEAVGELESFARAQLRSLFGARAEAAFRPGAVVTGWMSDPWNRGSYAYARPGHAGARAVLAEPLADGRLVFAGEATRTDGLAGTVGGAFLAGQGAAAAVLGAAYERPA
jgi:monoamine oxidase